MDRTSILFGFCLVAFAVNAAAQTNVTTTNGGTAGTVPVFTTGSNVENSPIAVSGGNVGIGTASQNATLTVNGTEVIGAAPYLISSSYSGGWGYVYHQLPAWGGVADWQFSSGLGYWNAVGITGNGAGGSNYGYGVLNVYNNSAATIQLMGSGSSYFVGGNVGIGTTSPAYTLDVAGQIHSSTGGVVYPDGTAQTTAWTGVLCGGDYAESVDVTGDRTKYEPGDVLVIDPKAPGKFLKSSDPYSTAVLGVYSTKPGAVGRRQTTPKSTDEVPMAMVGIVPTKVSAENGAIKPGDLLVTASIPGYAMKGTDRSRMLGAVIGKALGSLDAGAGMIEVGVTLQ